VKPINQNTEALRELLESTNNLPEGGYNALSLYIEGLKAFSLTASSFGGITRIRASAFKGSRLESIEVPEGVTQIGTSAFESCDHLKSVILPSTIESINNSAFYGCSTIESFEIRAINPPRLFNQVFGNTHNANRIVIVPAGCAQAYQDDASWRAFGEIVEATE
jgi:hypothetical protein